MSDYFVLMFRCCHIENLLLFERSVSGLFFFVLYRWFIGRLLEVSKILVNILVDKSTDLQAESYKQLNLFLDKHYSEICIFFPENLIWKLFVILRECECEKCDYKNIAQLAVKCLNIIRKSGGLNKKIYINQNFYEIIRKNRNNS